MAFQITKRIILSELFKSEAGVNLYNLHRKYRLPFNEVILVLDELKSLELVVIEDLMIFPTRRTKEWIYLNRSSIFFAKNNCEWKDIPQEFLTEKLGINVVPALKTK